MIDQRNGNKITIDINPPPAKGGSGFMSKIKQAYKKS